MLLIGLPGVRPPTQDRECLIVAALNLLRLQLHAMITHNMDSKSVGLGNTSTLLNSIKQRCVNLASVSGILVTIQEAAQAVLKTGWSILLPTANERAKTLSGMYFRLITLFCQILRMILIQDSFKIQMV